MDPNSQHQLWSKWTFDVVPEKPLPGLLELRTNLARFGRKAFGSASQMRITVLNAKHLRVEVRTEGSPAHDPGFQTYMQDNWDKFFKVGFGLQTTSECQVKVEAGDLQDGKPREQLIVLPKIQIPVPGVH